MKKIDYWFLAFCILVSELFGALGGIFNMGSIDSWYYDLQKSFFNPPDWIFAPVWVALFALLGVSLYLVTSVENKKNANFEKYFSFAMIIFIIQWILNVSWSFIFFYFRDPLLAFSEMIVLIFSICLTIYFFYRLRPAAAYCLVPYLFWVIFAAYLNYAVWQLN